eukprot:6246397-Pyramimonas_sp.AAC.1
MCLAHCVENDKCVGDREGSTDASIVCRRGNTADNICIYAEHKGELARVATDKAAQAAISRMLQATHKPAETLARKCYMGRFLGLARIPGARSTTDSSRRGKALVERH